MNEHKTTNKMQFTEMYKCARKSFNNTDYSSKKHYQSADEGERHVSYARWWTTGSSGLAAVGSTLSGLANVSSWPRLVKYGPFASAALAASATYATTVFLNPTYVQRPVHHRQAGFEYATVHTEYQRFLDKTCLNTKITLDAIQKELQVVEQRKADIDNRFKDINPSSSVHKRVKPFVHGMPPKRGWLEDENVFLARWTDQHRDRDAKIIKAATDVILAEREAIPGTSPHHIHSIRCIYNITFSLCILLTFSPMSRLQSLCDVVGRFHLYLFEAESRDEFTRFVDLNNMLQLVKDLWMAGRGKQAIVVWKQVTKQKLTRALVIPKNIALLLRKYKQEAIRLHSSISKCR